MCDKGRVENSHGLQLMAQPARPRPRPRLVSRQPAASDEARAVVDEDDAFRRNRGRTTQHWRQLEQSAASKYCVPLSAPAHLPPGAIPFTRSDDDWDLEDPGDGSFPKSRKKKRPIKQNDRPRWQDTDVARMCVQHFPLYLGSAG